MRVLMFGWEFPPFHFGGLGTACYGLVKGLSKNGAQVTFVLPRLPGTLESKYARIYSAELPNLDVMEIPSPLIGYMTFSSYKEFFKKIKRHSPLYGANLLQEVHRFASCARNVAGREEFDVIHAHDWMTYRAGIEAKNVSKKPLVVHVHATEFDRTGSSVNQAVYDLEREGFHAADAIISVSNYTKRKVVEHYGIDEQKVHVVHNAIDLENVPDGLASNNGTKTVLFLGRVTMQKGPDYFIYAAKKVLEKEKDVRFIVAGSGDMHEFIIEKAAEMGIADKILFTGFLYGSDVERAYRMADVFVMPSVSEPFGLTALEAMSHKVPIIISKQSGVSEVVNHCLRVDFWDVDRLANKILGVLKYKTLKESLSDNGYREVKKFDWVNASKDCLRIYNRLLGVGQW